MNGNGNGYDGPDRRAVQIPVPQERRRGRPPLDPERRADVDVRLKLSPACYAVICKIALKTGQDNAAIIRKVLEREASRLADLVP